MFSRRTGWDRDLNELTALLERLRGDGEQVLDLTVSNPTRSGLAWEARDVVAALDHPDVSRHVADPAGLRSAREAVAAHLSSTRGCRGIAVEPADLLLSSSTSEAYAWLFKLLCDPGDAVMVPSPSYPLLHYLAELESVELVAFRLRLEERWRLDVDALAARLPERARAVVVVHPNNPTGSFLRDDEIRQLVELCEERELALISDEVFADFAWGERDVDVAPTLLESAARGGALAACLGGLSKSCGLPQLKLAWCALAGPEGLRREARERLAVVADTWLSVAAPVQLALPELLRKAGPFRAATLERVRSHRRLLEERCGAAGVALLPAEAGWSSILRLPERLSADRFARELLLEDGVLVHPGWLFDLEEHDVVVSLLPPPLVMQRGVERLLSRVTAR